MKKFRISDFGFRNKSKITKKNNIQTIKIRKSWGEYFMSIAELVAERSTCERRNVGCVLVRDKRIVATGYNGAPAGVRHCAEVGCIRGRMGVASGERHELCRGVHAEQNAIIQAATFGVDMSGAIAYTTHQPCFICTKMLINARVKKIIYQKGYPDRLAIAILKEARIPCVRL
jgi:dCMP deaminase